MNICLDNCEFKDEFSILAGEIEKIFLKNPEAVQAIAIMTQSQNIYCIVNKSLKEATYIDNNLFMKLVQTKDTDVKYIICKWNGYSVDVPSWSFRKKLLEINSNNANAKILLLGFDGYIVKNVKDIMPE